MIPYAHRKNYGYNKRAYQVLLETRKREYHRCKIRQWALIVGVVLASACIAGLVIYVYVRYGIAI